MPYKCQTNGSTIPEKHDKRVKLTKSQKEEIYNIYNLYGAYSHRELADMYGVSKRLITFIVNPETKERNLQAREDRGGSKQYYDKDKHRVAMKTHRDHKQRLHLKGELDERR